MESRLYIYPRCRKNVKSINSLTKHINICKILITLSYYQPSILALILAYNMINHPNLLLDNFEEDIYSKVLNNSKKKIRLADINNNKEDIRPADIDK